MAKFCTKCGYEMTGNFCTKCGSSNNNYNQNYVNYNRQPKRNNGCLVVILCVICCFLGLGIILAITEGDVKEVAPDTNKIYKVGETVSCPNFDITINEFGIKQKGEEISSYQVVSDPEWVGVIVTVKNKSDSEATFSTGNFKLENSNGEILDHSIISYKVWGNYETLNSPTLISGGTKTGYVSFANNNNDNSNLKLKVNCNDGLFSEDTIFTYELK